MPNFGPMIAASAKLGLGYAERLLKDVTPDQFGRFATVGDTVIESNHPAFIYGHLSLYSPRVIEATGGDAAAFQPSAKFLKMFSKDAKCVDDPDGSIYPAMTRSPRPCSPDTGRRYESLETAEDDLFIVENPNQVMREKFPHPSAMLGFYIGGHFMLHIGQMSAWRAPRTGTRLIFAGRPRRCP